MGGVGGGTPSYKPINMYRHTHGLLRLVLDYLHVSNTVIQIL